MKVKYLTILFIAISMFFIACSEDSITEAVIGTNSVTITGDINKSFDAQTIASLMQEDGVTGFVMLMQPEGSTSEEDLLNFVKISNELPAVGQYEIGENYESGEDFIATYTPNDSTISFMHSGSVNITESGTSKIAGTFDMTGYYFDYPIDSTRVLNITGEFSTIPADLN